MGHYDFGELLPAERDPGQLHADSAEAPAQSLRRLFPPKRELPARGVLAAAGAAAAEQREQQTEEQGEQCACAHHALALVGLQTASTGDRIARVLMAAAGLCAVHAVEPRRARQITVGSVDARSAQATPRLEVAVAAAAVGAHECAVLAVSAIAALGLAPVADPARVAACALASDVIAGVPIATRRAAVAAALAVETSGARLVTLRAVPAGLTGQAAAFRHGAWLLALALAASATAAQAVETRRARLPAVLATVARLAGARAVHRVAAAVEALAVALAARAERALTALAAAALLLAWRGVAGALIVAAAAPPACVAQARACLWIAARRGAAVARAGALRAPPARLAATRAAPRVARAVLALARMLTACSPAPRVTRTLACHVLALPVRVADTQLLAVGAPELARALGVAGGTEVAMAAAALPRPHAHLVLRARGVAFAHRCR